MVPPNDLTRKIQEVFGAEAGDRMADWMQQTEQDHRALRQELAEFRQEVRADLAELRHQMDARFAEVRSELRSEIADVRSELRTEIAGLRAEMRVGLAAVDGRFGAVDSQFAAAEAAAERRHSDFMKWMLGFWAASLVALVAALYGLAQIVR